MFIPTVTVPAVLSRVEDMVIMEDCNVTLEPETAPISVNTAFEFFAHPATKPINPEFWLPFCLEAGMPTFGIDTNAKTLPPELGDWFDSHFIAYDKGCYTGQEILQRMHSRGHTNKTWRVFTCESKPESTEICTIIGDKAGDITQLIAHPGGGYLVAGVVRNEFDVHSLTASGHALRAIMNP
jgi:folate-binding protein YgfZ